MRDVVEEVQGMIFIFALNLIGQASKPSPVALAPTVIFIGLLCERSMVSSLSIARLEVYRLSTFDFQINGSDNF
jgi:hypothetical protein